MAPSPSTETSLAPDLRARLLGIARDAIRDGLRDRQTRIEVEDFPLPLRARRASFVTLQIGGRLRGCIGHLEASQPLVADVADNARAAAFRDPRFAPLTDAEYAELSCQISILTPPEPIQFASEADLLRQLRPGSDGLILEEGRHRGTFLPSVWQELPDPARFLHHLKRKAGLPENFWSERLRCLRYTTESFGD